MRMLAFLNLGPFEVVVIAVVAILVFGRNLPQAASKAYMQFRKLKNALEDLRRESGIDRELRNIERTVREAEWEARKAGTRERRDWRAELPEGAGGPATVARGSTGASEADDSGGEPAAGEAPREPERPTDAAS